MTDEVLEKDVPETKRSPRPGRTGGAEAELNIQETPRHRPSVMGCWFGSVLLLCVEGWV